MKIKLKEYEHELDAEIENYGDGLVKITSYNLHDDHEVILSFDLKEFAIALEALKKENK